MRKLHFTTAFLTALITTSSAHADILGGPVTNAVNGHVYFLLTQNTWTASEVEARTFGGHLATINDAAENQWVFDTFSNFGGTGRVLWIGLNDVQQPGQFAWSGGQPVAYVNWAPGEPNFIGQEHYVYIYSAAATGRPAGQWNNDYDRLDLGAAGPLHGVVEIDRLPPTIITQPRSQNFKTGSPVTFTVSAIGLPPLSFQWQKDGANIPGATSGTFMISGATETDVGTYQVIVSNAIGVVTSQTALLEVRRTGFTTLTVTRTNVTGPGSLPVLINQANATSSDVVIEFAVSGTIALVAPLPTITNNVTINGRTDNPITISGSAIVPIFTFAAGTENILNRLILVDGNTDGDGAAVNNAGMLFVNNCVITNHNAKGQGGAVRNSGQLVIAGSTLSRNRGSNGGAVYNSGSLVISDSQLSSNEAAINGNGGAILSTGVLNSTNSTFIGNKAGLGAALFNLGKLQLTVATVSSNTAQKGPGGGLFNAGDASIAATTFTGNAALGESGEAGTGLGGAGGGGGGGLGGGVYTSDGKLSLTNCTISGNLAAGGDGGRGSSQAGFAGSGGRGGGQFGGLAGSSSRAPEPGGFVSGGGGAASSIGPVASPGAGGFGGGGGGGAAFTVKGVNSGAKGGFGAGNGGNPGDLGPGAKGNVGGGGGGGSGIGGGLFVESGTVILVNCTLSENKSFGGKGGAALTSSAIGEGGQGMSGGVFNHTGNIKILNCVLAQNTASNSSPDLAGAFLSSGFNLVGNSQGASGLSVNDFQNVAANLGPLQDNGGPTLTHALLQSSLAIGGGTSVGAPSTDQRGVVRPADRVDIGAFQIGTVISPAISWSKPADIVYGTPLGSAQLNATVGVDGTLVYSPAAGTILPAGSNTLTAIFTPKDLIRYTASTNSVTITVLKADQTINFPAISNKNIGDPPILLAASASSGLPVIFSVVAGPATLTGNLLSLGASSGFVTVRASQPGNNNYNPAAVDRSFVLGTLPLPVITTQPASQTVNPGDRVTFGVVATNGPLSFQWRFSGAAISGAFSSSLVLTRVKADQAGPYDLILSNPSGSVTSKVATLVVNISPGTPKIVTHPQSLSVRLGESATLSVTASGTLPLSFQWYAGVSGDVSVPIPGATNSTFAVPSTSTNITFWASVRNSLGVVDSDTALVRVLPANAAKLGLRMISGLPALNIDGSIGTIYRVEFTTSLSAPIWTKLIELPLPSSPFVYVDPGAAGSSSRFYRVLVP